MVDVVGTPGQDDVAVRIDEAGHDRGPSRIDHRETVLRARILLGVGRPDPGDSALGDQDTEVRFEPRRTPGREVGVAELSGTEHRLPPVGPGATRHDQAPTPQAIPLRSNAMKASDSHEPWKVGGVLSAASTARPARIAGLWQWPGAK